MQIITNNKPRALVCLAETDHDPSAWDYIDGEDRYFPRLVQYKGEWYDVHDTMSCRTSRGGSALPEFAGWDCFISDSFFSGVVFRFVNDNDVIVGRYYS